MSYVNFTKEERERARTTDLVELLKSQGEPLKRSGSEYEWLDGSQKVTVRGNLWFHQYERVGGDTIDFVRRFYNQSYTQAMEFLLGSSYGTIKKSPPVVKEAKSFELPKPYHNMNRVKSYLHNIRGIDEDVIRVFADKNMIYESADYHNSVFVGFDKNSNPQHASKRGIGLRSTYKANAQNSNPEYSFHWIGKDKFLYLFEAPIDMLSFISMHKENWKNQNYAASCSVSDRVLFQCLKDYPYIENVYICFDNDEPGQAAADRISTKLFALGLESKILIPTHKDWNEELLAVEENEIIGDENQCQALQL